MNLYQIMLRFVQVSVQDGKMLDGQNDTRADINAQWNQWTDGLTADR